MNEKLSHKERTRREMLLRYAGGEPVKAPSVRDRTDASLWAFIWNRGYIETADPTADTDVITEFGRRTLRETAP